MNGIIKNINNLETIQTFWRFRAIQNRKGAALLTVLIALMIITLILFEFQYTSMVERKLAYNELEQLQAYYLSKSGTRIALLRLALFAKISNSSLVKNQGKNLNLTPYLNKIWQIPFPPFPFSSDSIKDLTYMQDKSAAEKLLKQTHVTNGQSVHTITQESSKFNLNYLIVPEKLRSEPVNFDYPNTLFTYIGKSLITLIEGFLAKAKDPAVEYDNIRPNEVINNIMDWVNPGAQSYGGGDRDGFYEQQDPPYKAKRNRFYTIDELRLVKGINEKLFKELRPYVTVYSYDGKININQAKDDVLRAFYPDFTEDDLKRLNEEKQNHQGEWPSVKTFMDFIVNTLGRSQFAEIYNSPEEYPFATDSQSFLIEGSGIIQKSASSIQKNIQVAVALTSGSDSGVEVAQNIKDEATCRSKAGYFWDNREGQKKCRTKPRTQEACIEIAGEWQKINEENCCKLNQQPAECLTKKDPKVKKSADRLKILYWRET